LRLGAAGTRLYIQEGTVRVHLAGKHALKFEPFDFAAQPRNVGFDLIGGTLVGLFGGKLEQFSAVFEPPRQAVQTSHDLFEFGALFAELLRAVRVIPDSGLLEFARYFLEAFVFIVVIKDTSSRTACAPRDL